VTIERGITIQQPYALVVVKADGGPGGNSWKCIENRNWPTQFRGSVVIHAATSKAQLIDEGPEFFLRDAHPELDAYLNHPKQTRDNHSFYFGAAIGVADIVGCVPYDPENGDDFEANCRAAGFGEWLAKHSPPHSKTPAGYWASGKFCILLDNVRQFRDPIPMRGRLNIFRLTEAEKAAIEQALRGPMGDPFLYRLSIAGKGGKASGGKGKAPGKRKKAEPEAAGKS
jgi:hypothetical protein